MKENGCYVFNETAKAQFDMKLGDKIGDDEIIGFMPDVKFASFRQAVSPMAFFLWGKYQRWSSSNKYYGQLYVKFKGGQATCVPGWNTSGKSLAKFDAEYPFNVRFFDEVFAADLRAGVEDGLPDYALQYRGDSDFHRRRLRVGGVRERLPAERNCYPEGIWFYHGGNPFDGSIAATFISY